MNNSLEVKIKLWLIYPYTRFHFLVISYQNKIRIHFTQALSINWDDRYRNSIKCCMAVDKSVCWIVANFMRAWLVCTTYNICNIYTICIIINNNVNIYYLYWEDFFLRGETCYAFSPNPGAWEGYVAFARR